jgi:dolichol-phosphate mannosyltransferase
LTENQPLEESAMKTVSVIVPVYFNAESLPLLFERLQVVEGQLHERGCAMELIFVDDGSGDESLFELLNIKQRRPDTKIVKLTRNFGAMHSCKVGLNYITGDCAVWVAADLQDPPELVIEMTDQWLAGSKFVIALRESRVDPPITTFFSGIYHRLVRIMISKDYPKSGIDFVLMDAALVPYLRDSGKNIDVVLLAHWLGFKPATVNYHRPKRLHGKSRWTFGKKLKRCIDSILGFSVLPIRFISLIGFIIALLSFVYGWGFVVIPTMFGYRDVAGFPTLVALLSFLLGLVIVILGIIAEYVWRIFDEVTNRPEVVVDEVY